MVPGSLCFIGFKHFSDAHDKLIFARFEYCKDLPGSVGTIISRNGSPTLGTQCPVCMTISELKEKNLGTTGVL